MHSDLNQYLGGNYIKKEVMEHVTKVFDLLEGELKSTRIYIKRGSKL